MNKLTGRIEKGRSLNIGRAFEVGKRIGYGVWDKDRTKHNTVYLKKAQTLTRINGQAYFHDMIMCECGKHNGRIEDCKGNSYSTICYHCLATISHHMNLKGCSIEFYEDKAEAYRYKGMGSLVKVVSEQGRGRLWAVVKGADSLSQTVNEISNRLEERITLLRGPAIEQDGID